MGLLSQRVEKTEIKPGDHIYTWRAVYTYSHHGKKSHGGRPLLAPSTCSSWNARRFSATRLRSPRSWTWTPAPPLDLLFPVSFFHCRAIIRRCEGEEGQSCSSSPAGHLILHRSSSLSQIPTLRLIASRFGRDLPPSISSGMSSSFVILLSIGPSGRPPAMNNAFRRAHTTRG